MNQVKAYWQDEEGAEDIKQILFYILGFGFVAAVGWALWSFIKNQAKGLDSVTEKTETVNNDPFGDGENPFKS